MYDVEQITALAQQANAIASVESRPVAIVSDGCSVKDLEGLLTAPLRCSRRQSLSVLTVASLVLAFEDRRENAFEIRSSLLDRRIQVLLDPSRSGKPSWEEYVLTLNLLHSDEYADWAKIDGEAISQGSFAEFLEDHAADIVSNNGETYDAGQMLDVATNLQAATKVKFRSGVNIQNGNVQLQFEEQTETAAKGGLEVPKRFFIGIQIFKGGPSYQIECRLRYRIHEGNLTFTVKLHRLQKAVEKCFDDIEAEVVERLGQQALRVG